MNSQSIEFNRIDQDKNLPKIVRKLFRVPVEDRKNIRVSIGGKEYPILDICQDGLGILLEDYSGFNIDQALDPCRLKIYGTVFDGLKGRIVHFSTGPDQDWRCGIQWLDLPQDSASGLSKLVSELKTRFLDGERKEPDNG